MNPSLTFALWLSMAFNSILCLPSHTNSPSRYAMALKHRRTNGGFAESSLIPNSYTFFIKRSLSPFGNLEAKIDRKLAARSNGEDEEDCDEEEEDEEASSYSSPNTTADNSQVPTATDTVTAAAPSPTSLPVSVGTSSSIDIGSSSSTSSASSSSSETYDGKATFFTQGGVAGSCGTVHSDSDYIVAIDSSMYNSGEFCGKSITVTRVSTGKSINCVGADECPGCPSSGSLDLSVGAFNALGTPDEGVFDITWKVAS